MTTKYMHLTKNNSFNVTKTLYIEHGTSDLKIMRFCGALKKIIFRCTDATYKDYYCDITIDILFRSVEFHYTCKGDENQINVRERVQSYIDCYTIGIDELLEFYKDLIVYLFF